MAAVPDARCAEIARTLDEPMVGTAPSTRRWLCLERTEPWPGDINHDRDPTVRALLARAAAAGFRPLMIRSTERGPERRPPRIFLTDTAPGRTITTVLDIERPGQLDDLPLPEPDHPLPGDPVNEPAVPDLHPRAARPLLWARRAAHWWTPSPDQDVFAASHLGGHRFAPTALVLPTGYVYGRLEPTSAAAIRVGAAAGEITTDRCRGRCTWSPRGQVAELAVREATGLRSPDALIVEDDSDDTVHVAAATGERWAVDVESVEVDATRPVSCGARPTLMVPLRAAAVRALRPGS